MLYAKTPDLLPYIAASCIYRMKTPTHTYTAPLAYRSYFAPPPCFQLILLLTHAWKILVWIEIPIRICATTTVEYTQLIIAKIQFDLLGGGAPYISQRGWTIYVNGRWTWQRLAASKLERSPPALPEKYSLRERGGPPPFSMAKHFPIVAQVGE